MLDNYEKRVISITIRWRLIQDSDANGDIVKCRWTIEDQGECNQDDKDICGKIFYDRRKRKAVAFLDKVSEVSGVSIVKMRQDLFVFILLWDLEIY